MASQKILIIDDSKVIRMQVKDMLPKGNFDVMEAQDGVDGLELIAAQVPHLVLLDFFMPRMNGWEVVQKMQTEPRLKLIPVVMMSGRKEDVMSTVPELFEYFEFLNKPFDPPTLLQAIRAAMAKAKVRQQSMPSEPLRPVPPPATVPSDRGGATEMQRMKADIQRLQQQNAQLQRELESVKKQMAQVVAFVKQKLT